ncbi:MlaD family protein [Conexibacter sp. SYSU D00693]|uniref:MlaD family protein n=1 Tax=Conexibacter sp. SYSU D00693 TaxID=2812560 RepID=UPI00196AB387|nr:MlaD family protein [Conexibacter sp. SYSU D00693]
MRRPTGAVAAHPVLVGAVTVLVAAVAVLLAGGANRGLPFVPAYELRVELPDAAGLTPGAEVRLGGSRAGTLDRLEPVARRRGGTAAVAVLRLERRFAPLREGTTAVVRPRSLLGLKQVELTAGRTGAPLPDGATLPVRQARPQPVELDELLGTFDDATRRSATASLRELGTTLTGRGEDLNAAIAGARGLLDPLRAVNARLAAPRARLARLVPALGRVAAEVAPAAEAQAGLLRGAARTFAALDRASAALDDTLAQAPAALDAAVRDLPVQRPLLRRLSALTDDLAPGARALRGAAGDLEATARSGPGALRASRSLWAGLEPTARALDAFAGDTRSTIGLRALTGLADAADPLLASVSPAQTTCNLVTLLLRNTASLLSEGGRTGTWQRFSILATPQGPDNEGGSAAAPANGPGVDNHLHSNPYPHTAGPGEPRECEAGNEPYVAGETVIGNPAGTQGSTEEAGR